MGHVLVDRFSPLVVTQPIGVMGADAMTRLLDDVSALLRRADGTLALVYDAGAHDAGRADAGGRAAAGEWFRREGELLARACSGIDFAFPSAVSRGMLSTVFWIARPSIPVSVHETSRAAIASAIARAGRQDELDVDAILRTLAARQVPGAARGR